MRIVTRLFVAHLALALGPAVALAGDGNPPAPQTKTPPAANSALTDHTKMLDPIQVDSLTVTPIEATTDAAPKDQNLTVLDEAMSKKLVTISEKPNKEVNALVLTNKSDQALFLMSGEVIIGGEQDRIIGRNTIIPPKTTQDVPVFCVEHGRWSGNSKEFTTAKALAHGRLRGKASYSSQQAVWDEVATKNEARKTETSTGTYRKVALEQSDGSLAAMQKQVDGALAKLPEADRNKLVGFAVSLNGKVASVDVFNSPALFGKLETKLLHSYLTEAIDIKAEKDIKAPTAADVKTFMFDADAAPAAASYDTPAAATEVYAGKRAFKAKVAYKPAAPPAAAHASPNVAQPAAAKADPADDVYENYQVK